MPEPEAREVSVREMVTADLRQIHVWLPRHVVDALSHASIQEHFSATFDRAVEEAVIEYLKTRGYLPSDTGGFIE